MAQPAVDLNNPKHNQLQNKPSMAIQLKKSWKKNKLVYIVLIPVFIHFAIFQGLPLVGSLFLSFMNWPIIGEPKFIGLANWKAVLHDEMAWQSLYNTTLFTLYYVVPTMALGLILASFLHMGLWGGKFFKGVFFLPVVTSFVVIAGIWAWLFNGNDYGIVNYVLSWFGFESISFFSSKKLALLTLAFLSVFKVAGSTMIYYLAGLNSIPRHLYESASIDGATGWKSFWLITFPLLKPTHFYVAIFTTIGSFQVFDSAYLLTGGGPDYSTTTIVYYMYTVAFTSLRLGYASVLAYILFMIILVISLIQKKYFGKEVSYY